MQDVVDPGLLKERLPLADVAVGGGLLHRHGATPLVGSKPTYPDRGALSIRRPGRARVEAVGTTPRVIDLS